MAVGGVPGTKAGKAIKKIMNVSKPKQTIGSLKAGVAEDPVSVFRINKNKGQ